MLKSISNYLFVTIEAETQEDTGFKGANGMNIILDTSYEPEHHATQVATVAVVPEKMTDAQWGEESEKFSNIIPTIKVGDKIWTEYKWFYDDNDPYRYIEYNSVKYYRVPYFGVFAILRDEIIPVGSWVIGKTITESQTVDKGVEGKLKGNLVTALGNLDEEDKAEIVHIGEPLKSLQKVYAQPGDTVGLAKYSHYKSKLNDVEYVLFRQSQITHIYEEN